MSNVMKGTGLPIPKLGRRENEDVESIGPRLMGGVTARLSAA